MSVESPAFTEWVPGDPLYPHPRHRNSGDGTYVREFFQLLNEDNERVRWATEMNETTCACADCLVTWSPLVSRNCWVCERPARNYDTAAAYVRKVYEERANMIVLRDGPWHTRLMEFPRDRDELLVPDGTEGIAQYVEEDYHEVLPTTIKVHRYQRRHFDWNTYKRWVFEYVGVV